MTKFKAQGFNNTFKNASKGFRLVLRSEMNIRIHFIIAVLILITAYLLDFSAIEYSIILMAIAIVVISEMLNTAIEYALDSIYHNKYSKMVGMAKDISAGAVMTASFVSILIGLLIFGSHILKITA